MTQAREPNDRDIFTRMAQVEYRLTRIENTNAQLQETIAPGGYITDAFERVVDRIDEVEDRLNARMDERFAEVNRRFDSQDARFDSQDAKLDIILRAITGLGNS
jgi:predicted nuclease with TOPRIM domain